MTEPSADVVVLGAGPAGLGAAYRLARSGRSVHVVERGPNVGGLAASFDVAGVRVDHGSHRLHPTTAPPVLEALRALLGTDLQRRRRNGRLMLGRRPVAFPPRPGDLARRLPARVAGRVVADAVVAPLRRPRDDSFEEVVRASLGPTIASEVYFPFARKLWAREPGDLDGELARRRVGARSFAQLVRKVVRRGPDAGTFHYPRRGYGQIVEALAEAATSAGACISTGDAVVDLHLGSDAVRARTATGACVEAGQAWSTLPLPALARVAGAPEPVQGAARALRTRALALVYVVVDRPSWTPFDAHYLPAPDVAPSRISEPKRYRTSADDPDDVTVLCAEIPCDVGDERWEATDEALAAMVTAAIERSDLPAVRPAGVTVRRVADAYPLYERGFAASLRVVDEWVGSRPRLLSFGRHGLYAHDNGHHALAEAWAAADALVDGQVDAGRWAAARGTFRSHVVED